MLPTDSTSLPAAVRDVFNVCAVWLLLSLLMTLRFLLGPALNVMDGPAPTRREVKEDAFAAENLRDREKLLHTCKLCIALSILFNLFFTVFCGRSLLLILHHDPGVGFILALLEMLLLASVLLLALAMSPEAVGRGSRDGSRDAINHLWQLQVQRLRFGIRGLCAWLLALGLVVGWLYFALLRMGIVPIHLPWDSSPL